jgi:serine/threonine protein kinase
MTHDRRGSTVGSYKIQTPIGQGGMSQVYIAQETQHNTQVAIKLFDITGNELDYFRRFQREIHTNYRLQHPEILPVLDYGRDEDVLFLVMPYISNGSLNDHLKKGYVLSPLQTLDLITQIGEALDYAHAAGVIHRDVKPHNILMPDEDRFMLADFGLIRLMDAATRLTVSGKIMGTPAYMSPEQAGGGQIDGISDIYSLGIVAYECLLGRLPFNFESPSHAVSMHVNALPLRPRDINPHFPRSLEKVLLHMLDKNPARRYQSGAELKAAFEKAITKLPASVRQSRLVTPAQINASLRLQHTLVHQNRKNTSNSLSISIPPWILIGALILSIGLYLFIRNSFVTLMGGGSFAEFPIITAQEDSVPPTTLQTDTYSLDNGATESSLNQQDEDTNLTMPLGSGDPLAQPSVESVSPPAAQVTDSASDHAEGLPPTGNGDSTDTSTGEYATDNFGNNASGNDNSNSAGNGEGN